RMSVAWHRDFEHSLLGALLGEHQHRLRGGWGRMYGRCNGGLNVFAPLLAPWLLQAVSCQGAVNTANAGAQGNQCLGAGGANPTTAFRIGTDGLVAPLPAAAQQLPQPFFPGTNGCSGAGCVSGTFFPTSGDSSA